MVIINAVEFKNLSQQYQVARRYLDEGHVKKIYTDNPLLYAKFCKELDNTGDKICELNDSLIAMWMKVPQEDSLVFITELYNTQNPIYNDIVENYNVIVVAKSSL